jgi:tetratricopeptide (TPR) repeat protein
MRRAITALSIALGLVVSLEGCAARPPTAVPNQQQRADDTSLSELRNSKDGYAKRHADRVELALARARRSIPGTESTGVPPVVRACLLAARAELDALVTELRAHPELARRAVMAFMRAEFDAAECSRPEFHLAFASFAQTKDDRGLKVLGALRAAHRLEASDKSSFTSELARIRPSEGLVAYWLAAAGSDGRASDRLKAAVVDFERLGAWAYAARATDMIGNEGTLEDQIASSDKALELARKHLGPDNPVLVELLQSRAASHIWKADYSSGMPFMTRALELSRKLFGERHLKTADLQIAWLAAKLNLGEPRVLAEQTPALRDVLEPLLGDGHPDVLTCRTNAVTALVQLKQLTLAEAEGRAILELSRRVTGEKSQETADALMLLGTLELQRGNFEQAVDYLAKSNEITDVVLQVGHAHRYQGYIMLALAQTKLGRYDDARESIADARTRLFEAHGANHRHEQTIAEIESAVERMDPQSQKFGTGIPPETIRRIVQVNRSRFRQCYDEGLERDAKLRGKVVARLEIGTDGRVKVSDGGSSMPDRDVTTCVLHIYEKLVFPKHGGDVVKVLFPLEFAPSSSP